MCTAAPHASCICQVLGGGVAQETQAAFGNALRGVFLTPLKTTAFRALFTCAAHFSWLCKEAGILLHACIDQTRKCMQALLQLRRAFPFWQTTCKWMQGAHR